jgi:hypothetical protein
MNQSIYLSEEETKANEYNFAFTSLMNELNEDE